MRLSKVRKDALTGMMRDTIFEAALSVLQEHGIQGMTMDRVAAAAGSAKGSLYNYFSSKDDLLRFVYMRIVEPISQMIEQIAHGDLPPPRKLDAILHALLDHFLRYGRAFGLLVNSETIRDIVASAKRSGRAHALEHFTAIFDQGIREESFRPHNPADSGRMFLGCVGQLFDIQTAADPSEPARRYVDSVITMFLRAVSAGTEAASDVPDREPGTGRSRLERRSHV